MTSLRDVLTAWLGDADPVKRLHARNRLAMLDGDDQAVAETPPLSRIQAAGAKVRAMPRATLTITCLYASPGLAGSCLPIRCWAARGRSCGGSHSDEEHCLRCLSGRDK